MFFRLPGFTICVALLSHLCGIQAQAEANQPLYREFFVSPLGSDRNVGSRQQPFQTLAKAQEAVRTVIPGMSGNIVVTIAGGAYPMQAPLVLSPEDSATGKYRIIYQAAAKETPVFTGGVPVTGWEPYKNGIWKAPLKRDHKLRALYVNGHRAFMARSEGIRAQGGWGEYKVTAGQAPWAWETGNVMDGVKYNSSDLPLITRNASDVEIACQTTWNMNFIGVREITTDNGKYILKLQQPYGAIAQRIGWKAGLTFSGTHFVQNAFELLKRAGEFYFDRAEGTVYYIPRPGEDMTTASVVAPVTETLLEFRGEPLKRRVRNISFEGLTFAYTDYNLLDVAGSQGAATVQGACLNTAFANPNWHLDVYRAYDVLPGAVVINGVDGVEFIRNTIVHTGCMGLVMSNDINNLRVIGNLIADTGGGAISIGHPQHVYENDTADLKAPNGVGIEHEKFPAGTESIPRHVLVSNNFLPADAALFGGHSIITLFFGEDVEIVHNWIPNAPYSGMNVGWGWCDFDGSAVASSREWGRGERPAVLPGKPTTVCRNNLVRANRVEDTMSVLHDGGGIYTLGNQPGTVIERNYVRHSQRAIYTDEGSANMLLRENVTQGPYENAQFAQNWGRKHSLRFEKYFISDPRWDIAAPDCKFDYVHCPNAEWTKEAKEIIDESGIEPAFQDIVQEKWRSGMMTGTNAGGGFGQQIVPAK